VLPLSKQIVVGGLTILSIFDICLVNIYNEALRKRYEITIDLQPHLLVSGI